MSWSREGGRSGPRGYHHGNLKEALIRAALELIAQKGPAGFTFAEAARWAGVSPAAPYRHFRDRDELLIDVARRGFDRFAVTLESAWDGSRPDAFAAFDRVGKAYLQFARSEPAYYSAMFEAGIPPEASPELQEAGQRAFTVLRSATERLIATMPAQQRPPGTWWQPSPRPSGNRAFDEYRQETLRRLEEEQREFQEFLVRLRMAKDKAEFDQFMAERRTRTEPSL